jgi:hypothetical protein
MLAYEMRLCTDTRHTMESEERVKMSNDRLRTGSIGHAAQRPAKKTSGRSERERMGQHRDGGVSSTVLDEGESESESESERWANGGLCANRATGQQGLRAFRRRAAQLLQYGRSIKRCQAYALLWFRSICALLERDLVCTYRGCTDCGRVS